MSGQPAAASGALLRLLVVAYYFPPSGGAGVQRVLKWARYLPEHGVEPVVLTVREGAFPEHDETLLAEIPTSVDVVRTGGFDPFSLYARVLGRRRDEILSERTDEVGASSRPAERFARWVRANVFIPDARVGWVPFAAARGARLTRKRPLDVVLSSGPPHSAHLAASTISRLARLPWLADFRDPWTDIHYYDRLPRSRSAARVDAALERRVLRRASRIITVSPSWADLLAARGRRPVEVLPNGFDPADFSGPPPRRDSGSFVLAHVGSLYGSRDPRSLWRALGALKARNEGASIRVRIVGRVGEEVLQSAAEMGVAVERTGYVSHAEAVREMRAADALLLSTEPHTAEEGHIPGKLFEYLASDNPVIGLGDPRGDAAEIITRTAAGRMLARNDQDGVEHFIRDLYASWARGEPVRGADPKAIQHYSRQRQTGELAAMLRDMVVTSAP